MKESQWSFTFFLRIFPHFLLIIIMNNMFRPESCVRQSATKWENTPPPPQRFLSLIQELLTNFKQRNKENHSYILGKIQFSSVQLLSRVLLCDHMDCSMPGLPSPTPGIYSNSCPLSQWCHPTILSSVVPFSSCLQPSSIRVFCNESVLPIRWSMC